MRIFDLSNFVIGCAMWFAVASCQSPPKPKPAAVLEASDPSACEATSKTLRSLISKGKDACLNHSDCALVAVLPEKCCGQPTYEAYNAKNLPIAEHKQLAALSRKITKKCEKAAECPACPHDSVERTYRTRCNKHRGKCEVKVDRVEVYFEGVIPR